jgi:hypothetical protein
VNPQNGSFRLLGARLQQSWLFKVVTAIPWLLILICAVSSESAPLQFFGAFWSVVLAIQWLFLIMNKPKP